MVYSKASEYTQLQERIFRTLCVTTGTRITQSELAVRTGATSAAVGRALAALIEEGTVVVRTQRDRKLKEIELARDDHRVIWRKRAENLRALYASGLADDLIDAYPGCTLVLFGSYSRGEDTVTSDIDIAVVGVGAKTKPFERYGNLLERPVRLLIIPSIRKISGELQESLLNGIVIAGSVTP